MNEQIAVFTEYFERELPLLREKYQWKIPKKDDFDDKGLSNYDSNVQLKKFLNQKWKQASYEQKMSLAKFVVKDWGGIKNNKQSTLNSYVKRISKEDPLSPFKGVASYSKIFSIVDVKKFAIYDARVAVSLNAIQFNARINEGLAFNYPPGRNNKTGHVEKKVGFSQQNQFKVKSLVSDGWTRIKRDNTYQQYLQLLTLCLKKFPDRNLYDLEMILFANAEEEAMKAMKDF